MLCSTPISRKAAMEENPEGWRVSILSEFNSLKENEVYDSMDKSQLTQEQKQNIIPIRLLLNIKEDGRLKTRAVALGNRLSDPDTSCYSPVPRLPNLRAMLKIAVRHRLFMRQFDIKTAFLYAQLEEWDAPIFCAPPVEWRTHKNEIWKLKKALYGLKNAPFLFYRTLAKALTSSGWTQSKEEPCLFFQGKVMVLIYVDDLMFFGPSSKEIETVAPSVLSQFETKEVMPERDSENWEVFTFLGLKIRRKGRNMRISQENLVDKVLLEFPTSAKARADTPITSAEIERFRKQARGKRW